MQYSQLDVRVAEAADFEAVARLYREEAELHNRLERGWSLRPGFDWTVLVRDTVGAADREILVAESGGELVGFICVRVRGLAPRRRWPQRLVAAFRGALRRRLGRRGPAEVAQAIVGSPFGTIEDCFVERSARGNGVGRRLVEDGLRWLQDLGVSHVKLQVASGNEGALRFWRRCGFSVGRLTMDLDFEEGS